MIESLIASLLDTCLDDDHCPDLLIESHLKCLSGIPADTPSVRPDDSRLMQSLLNGHRWMQMPASA